MAYCPHCMRRVAHGKSCSFCKKPMNRRGDDKHLPVAHVMQSNAGREYIIGLARGQGGFGITYAAVDKQTDRRVAIKEYYPIRCVDRSEDHVGVAVKPGMDATFRGGMESFIKEGTMLFQLNTLPCVVHVQDWFKANNTAYLVMEFLDGVPMHRLVAAEHRIPPDKLMPLLPMILDDLRQLHEADIIHRDIAPDNIMVMPDGTPKLLDFGSARAMENNKSMTVMLKQGFTPIEQYLSHGKQGPWTDIYALCATFYYCLTGIVPPAAPDRLYDEFSLKPPSALGVQGLTREEEAALMAGLREQPVSRPQSVAAFAAMLPKRERKAGVEWLPEAKPAAPKPTSATVSKPTEAKTAASKLQSVHSQTAAGPKTETIYVGKPDTEQSPPSQEKPEDMKKTKRYWLRFGIILALIMALAIWLMTQLGVGRAEQLTASDTSIRIASAADWKGDTANG